MELFDKTADEMTVGDTLKIIGVMFVGGSLMCVGVMVLADYADRRAIERRKDLPETDR